MRYLLTIHEKMMDEKENNLDLEGVLRDITGEAMKVHAKYKPGLLESAYEAALTYLLEQKEYTVARQVFLPIYWDDVQLNQSYRLDMVVNGQVIIELKAVSYVETPHRRQLWSYMNLTHTAYGMLINFGSEHLYTECYHRHPQTGYIKKMREDV